MLWEVCQALHILKPNQMMPQISCSRHQSTAACSWHEGALDRQCRKPAAHRHESLDMQRARRVARAMMLRPHPVALLTLIALLLHARHLLVLRRQGRPWLLRHGRRHLCWASSPRGSSSSRGRGSSHGSTGCLRHRLGLALPRLLLLVHGGLLAIHAAWLLLLGLLGPGLRSSLPHKALGLGLSPTLPCKALGLGLSPALGPPALRLGLSPALVTQALWLGLSPTLPAKALRLPPG